MANLRVDKITSTETFETTGSVQFDGSGDYLDVSDSSDWDFGTGPFTIECWVLMDPSTVGYSGIFGMHTGSTQFQFRINNVGTIQFLQDFGGTRGNTDDSDATGVNLRDSTWHHVAMVRQSDYSWQLYVDGKVNYSGTGMTGNVTSINEVAIGRRTDTNDYYLNGFISNMRVLNRAIYTKNFKPPMRELENIPGTVLLACQSKTDASLEKTGKVITANGNAVASELTPGILTPVPKSGAGSAITGSVEFNYEDYFEITSADLALGTDPFTIEWWMYASEQTEPGTANRRIFRLGANNATGSLSINFDAVNHDLQINYNDTTLIGSSSLGVHPESWYHISLVREGTGSNETKLYINGILSDSGTLNSDVNFSQTTLQIGNDSSLSGDFEYAGYITNLRVIRSSAIYSGLFTPPTRKLKRVPGTVLLCCQDEDSVTTEATGKTITTSGNPTASNFTPQIGDDRQVTFEGVTKINTDAYFYLPTGDTASREATGSYSAGTRGLFGGGNTPTKVNTIEYITIASIGNGTDFGDLTNTPAQAGGAASNTRGIIGGGYDGSARTNVINYLTVASTGNALNFGDLTVGRSGLGACSSSTRAVFSGGTTASDHLNTIDYVTIASTGDAQDFGDLLTVNNEMTGCASPTRGIFGSGDNPSLTNTLQYITIATSGNSQDFGDLTIAADYSTGFSNSIRGIFYIGYTPNPASNIINFITISSTGNALDFGDAYEKSGARSTTGASSSTRGVVAGGDSPAKSNSIEYVTIASSGNGQDFGALANFDTASPFGLSNGHGGLG